MTSFFKSYQLLVDSNFVRFLSHVNNIIPTKNENSCNQIDLCVSGQGIHALRMRAKINVVHKNFLILIGTNDAKKGMKIRTHKSIWRCLLKNLNSCRCKVVVLTLLPMPRYASQSILLWRKYQHAIKKLKGVTVLDVVLLFIKQNGAIKSECFEKCIRRVKIDLIHLNKLGLQMLEAYLTEHLPPSNIELWNLSFEWHSSLGDEIPPTFSDSVMLTIGAVAQQGTTKEPGSGAGRTMMLMTFMALMFLYTSYSANIVALLQSSATNIRTLEDLLNSRLKLGVDDNVYNHYYFETAAEPIRKAIYEKKVAPKGQKPGWMKIDEGVVKLREGFFAFHGEQGQVYKLVADTFYESETCGIQEIQYLQFVELYFAIKKNSSYKEILKVGLRKIQESGIQSRELQRLYAKKPDCHSGGANFVSVGLIDAYPAFLVLGAGMGLSLLLLLFEKAIDRKLKHYN